MINQSVLIVDDDAIIRKHLSQFLLSNNHQVLNCSSKQEAMQLLKDNAITVVLLDLQLPDGSGMELLRDIKDQFPETLVIIMTAFATLDTAIEAVKCGAFEFLTKPFAQLEVVLLAVQRAVKHLDVVSKLHYVQSRLQEKYGLDNLVGNSAAMQNVAKAVRDIAHSNATVLITGESGTGKELVAQAVHALSQRNKENFVSCNCGALTESLLESELFGHAKGAFTDAYADKKGIFEIAHRGTLFLDELGDMPLSIQVKLLRALQDGEIRRVGDSRTVRVDVRVIAATNRNLEVMMRDGLFRQDLYYRINVIRIPLPALRDHLDDLEILVDHFIRKHNFKLNRKIVGYTPEFLNILKHHNWPGNVRELENIIERAMVITKNTFIDASDLSGSFPTDINVSPRQEMMHQSEWLNFTYKKAKHRCLESFNHYYLAGVLKQTAGNITKAAALAGMFRSNFKALMRKSNIVAKADAQYPHMESTINDEVLQDAKEG